MPDAEVLALLRELVAGQRELLAGQCELNERMQRFEVALDRLSPIPAIGRQDHRRLTTLLPLLDEIFESSSFLAADVLREPRLKAICPTGSTAAGQAKAVGRFFSRAAGVWVDGRCLEQRGRQKKTAVWGIARLGVSRFIKAFEAA